MHDMHMQASVEVISKSLYNEDAKHTPVLHGALDRPKKFEDEELEALLDEDPC